jgi:hypothetical protein
MRVARIKICLIAAGVCALALFLTGCEETASVRALDAVTSKTTPTVIEDEVLAIRMSFATGDKPYDVDEVILCDWNGIVRMPASWAFGDFVPDAVYSLHHFFSTREDKINFKTHMTFVSRNVYKRTDAEYTHRLPISGYPVLRKDGMVAAVGIAGSEGEGGCYLSILDLAGGMPRSAVPDGYTKDELESGSVVPLAWENRNIHAMMILGNGLGVYFVANEGGKVLGSVELRDTQFDIDDPPKGWLDRQGIEKRMVLALRGGYFVIDTESIEAEYFKLGSGAKVLGLTSDGQQLVWAELDGTLRKAVVRKRDIGSGIDDEAIPYGLGLKTASTKRVFYSLYQDCIYFELDGDIWRMDLESGVQGMFTDTPNLREEILWVL